MTNLEHQPPAILIRWRDDQWMAHLVSLPADFDQLPPATSAGATPAGALEALQEQLLCITNAEDFASPLSLFGPRVG